MGSLVNWKHGTSWESCQKLMKSTPPVDKIGVRLVQSKDPSLDLSLPLPLSHVSHNICHCCPGDGLAKRKHLGCLANLCMVNVWEERTAWGCGTRYTWRPCSHRHQLGRAISPADDKHSFVEKTTLHCTHSKDPSLDLSLPLPLATLSRHGSRPPCNMPSQMSV